MLIGEAMKATGLTKKAIEYYTNCDLISPSVLENGYRDYDEAALTALKKIGTLRKLNLSVDDIKHILRDETSMQSILAKRSLSHKREEKKLAILKRIGGGETYEAVSAKIAMIEVEETIIDKLLQSFPGSFGRFVCSHFARFLDAPIETSEQQAAYETIIEFLDDMDAFEVPKHVEDYLADGTKHIGEKELAAMQASMREAIENPENFLESKKEIIEKYLAYKESDEYKNSPAAAFTELMRKFQRASGYNDVFIPAMKRLSPSYAEYYRQLEIANDRFVSWYPDAAVQEERKKEEWKRHP